MWGFLTNGAFKGLVSSCCKKMLKDMGMPREAVSAVLLPAIMVAHAAYPNAKWGASEIDEIIERLPTPIMGWDQSGKLAHRFAHFDEMSVGQCLVQQYGMTFEELLESTIETCA